jgi:hypothetical protein
LLNPHATELTPADEAPSEFTELVQVKALAPPGSKTTPSDSANNVRIRILNLMESDLADQSQQLLTLEPADQDSSN